MLTPEFETTVPGMFVAGELGGMGLIRNALAQGRQAVEAIQRQGRKAHAAGLDLVIVGAGPQGSAAQPQRQVAQAAVRDDRAGGLGGCVFQYPRGKVVMTQPAELPLVGKMRFPPDVQGGPARVLAGHRAQDRVGAEDALPRARGSDRARRPARLHRAHDEAARIEAANVLLAIGRRGTPRKLGVPGEELPKVVYRLVDPEQYAGSGCWWSAAATARSRRRRALPSPAAHVVLSYQRRYIRARKAAQP